MRTNVRRLNCMGMMVVLLLGCDSATKLTNVVPLSATANPASRYEGGTGGFTTILDGAEFYGDDVTGDLGPTSQIQARIENYASIVRSLSCDYNSSTCTGAFAASHTGMWHVSSQTLGWKIRDTDTGGEQGVAVAKSGGTGCFTWATLGPNLKLFCTNKNQNNSLTATFSGQPRTVSGSLTTYHQAAYSWTAGVSIGAGSFSITPGTFGENSKTSNATARDWHDSSCDPYCPSSSVDPIDGSGGCTPAPGARGGAFQELPTDEEEWNYDSADISGPVVMCEKIMYFYRYSDGTTSEPWYRWQCDDGSSFPG
jgi:hypothetical protein